MSLDDLDDTPIDDDALPQPAKSFIKEIDDLLEQSRYQFAESTLSGIRETVERSRHATDGQRRAVANIRDSAHEDRGSRRGSRRYEGWSRR